MMVEFVLVLWGLTYLLTSSAIFAPVRKMVKRLPFGVMVYCPSCSGFWIGLGLASAVGWPLQTMFHPMFDAAVASAGMMAVVAHYVPSNAWQIEQVDQPANGE